MAYEQQRLADDLIDLELERVQAIIEKIASDPEPWEIKQAEYDMWKKVYEVCKTGRRTGCGITALGDMLAALGLKYDSDEAIIVTEQVMWTKMEAELDCTIDLSILRGRFECYDRKLEYTENQHGGFNATNDFYQMISEEFPEQFDRMIKCGRRNISFSTIAPTGTVSLMTQTSSGCEPIFMPYYMRRTKINPNEKDKRVDFVDQNGDSWTEYGVLHPKFKDWIYTCETITVGNGTKYIINDNLILDKNTLEQLFTCSPWYQSTANDIDWIKRVEIQAILQKYTSNAISSTINLPGTATKEEVAQIYMTAYDKGLKGVTVKCMQHIIVI
jgi:ribonucleoside-diphosphate reductase alpha chain